MKPAMPLVNPVAEIWAEDFKGLTGLGLHLAANRVITEHAIDLIVFHGDLLNVVEVVTLVIRQPQVGVVALQLLAGIGAQLQDVHAPVVLKSCEGLARRAPK